MNIELAYLYRDYSNYKNFNEVIFKNPERISIETIKVIIHEHLVDGNWFYASEWKVPDLHFTEWDVEDDHFLHEFDDVKETDMQATSLLTITEFLEVVKKAKKTLQYANVFYK